MECYKTCCVFGHWEIDIDENGQEKLLKIFEDYIVNKNVGTFYFGGFGFFDELCHTIITKLKQKYTHIKRVYIYEDYKYVTMPHKRPRWLKNEDYEEFVYFETRYTGFYRRIFFRNCEILNHSDYCIFYVDETVERSGSKKTLEQARRVHKEILNVFGKL